jgi:hypothetical protein
LLPVYLLIAYFTLVHAAAIASLRYRLPIEPFFIVMAADMACRLAEWFISMVCAGPGSAFFKK